MFTRLNAHRAALGLRQWTRQSPLDLAERDWAVQMAVNNQCYHGDFGGRAIAEGFTGWPWGEAGACGFPDAASALAALLDSPGHRFILEECCDMNVVGVGAARYPNGNWTFWILVGQQ
jgi:uncharacterized protein YkwD